MIKFLKLLSDIVDPNYWASKISKKTGLEEKVRNSKFRKTKVYRIRVKNG